MQPEAHIILDTFKFKDGKIFLKAEHIERCLESFFYLNKTIEESEVRSLYDRLEEQFQNKINADEMLRLLISEQGTAEYKIEIKKIEPLNSPLKLQLLKDTNPISLKNRFKFADRSRWSQFLAVKSQAADDVAVYNSKNELVETGRCNLFLFDEKSDCVYTPALETGCLNGVYRRHVLKSGFISLPGHANKKKVFERIVQLQDIDSLKVYVTNSVREVLPALIIKN